MHEGIDSKILALVDNLLARLDRDVKNCPPQDLNHIAHVIMEVYNFTRKIDDFADRLKAETTIMQNIAKSMEDRKDKPSGRY